MEKAALHSIHPSLPARFKSEPTQRKGPSRRRAPASPHASSSSAAHDAEQVLPISRPSSAESSQAPHKVSTGDTVCPLCHESIPASSYAEHFVQELAKFESTAVKLPGPSPDTFASPFSTAPSKSTESAASSSDDLYGRGKRKRNLATGCNTKTSPSSKKRSDEEDQQANSSAPPLAAFQQTLTKVKSNRKAREDRGKSRSRQVSTQHQVLLQEVACFICGELVYGSNQDVNEHIDRCLARQAVENERQPTGDSTEDEDSAAGETLQPAKPLTAAAAPAPTPPSASASQPSTPVATHNDLEGDLDIADDDSTHLYGHVQYTERDVQRHGAMLDAAAAKATATESESLRELVAESAGATPTPRSPQLREQMIDEPIPVESEQPVDASPLALLKRRVKELALSAKKVCPQCQQITSAGDLRRVYW
ncbi:hypothetical protein RI367_001675 [Sorochytrium milnesiophthora]